MVEGVQVAVYLEDGHLEEGVVWTCWEGKYTWGSDAAMST